MSRIRVEVLGEGQHPSERMIAVTTAGGQRENVMVDRRSIRNNEIEVGYPVASDGDRYLVELPRETTTGQWRVWVNRSDLIEGRERQHA
jgi:hypothetical protein